MMVDCSEGALPVETLAPGDRVLTRDHGPRPVIWTARREAVFGCEDYTDRPIRISARWVGADQDLIVSPHHRILAMRDGAEVLVPAKALVSLHRIRQMRGCQHMIWHHFALATHERVRVNGLWSESLLLGPMVLNGLPRQARSRLLVLFKPTCDDAINGPPARPCLTIQQTRAFLKRHEAQTPGLFLCDRVPMHTS